MEAVIKVVCGVHGARLVPPISPVGPTFTRPELYVIPRIDHQLGSGSGELRMFSADPACNHCVTYGHGGGYRCIRCPGWFCA